MTSTPRLITYDGQTPAAQVDAPLQLEIPNTDGILTYSQAPAGSDGVVTITAELQELNAPPRTVLRLDYATPDAPAAITLTQLQVQPDYQGLGHGKRAVRHVVNAARTAGYRHCDAVTIDEASVAWIIPVEKGALEAGPGELTFDLNDADEFYLWLNAGEPLQAA